jgi:hypothetical protein
MANYRDYYPTSPDGVGSGEGLPQSGAVEIQSPLSKRDDAPWDGNIPDDGNPQIETQKTGYNPGSPAAADPAPPGVSLSRDIGLYGTGYKGGADAQEEDNKAAPDKDPHGRFSPEYADKGEIFRETGGTYEQWTGSRGDNS